MRHLADAWCRRCTRLVLFPVLLCACFLAATCFAKAAPVKSAGADTSAVTPDLALREILDAAKQEAAHSCAPTEDRLRAIICAGTIRIGVRDNYPPFAAIDADRHAGFEIAIAEKIAQALGVSATLVTVTPANRLALLAEDRVDLVIATMGDTTLRDSQAHFVRPHYYASHTAIVGPRSMPLTKFADIAGRTICVTVGNYSNPDLTVAGSRLLLFANPEQLADELQSGACSLIAQDDTFLARYFADPKFAAAYNTKLVMDPLPWGMAVSLAGSERLATALSLVSEIFHRDGVFVELAGEQAVAPAFLIEQRAVWLRPDCDTAQGFADPDCVLLPRRTEVSETRFASAVTGGESWVKDRVGLSLNLEVFKLQPAWDLVREGARNSLILILGTLTATLAVALLVGRALSARLALLRWVTRSLVMGVQSTPPVLALVIAASTANAIFSFSALSAISSAILALGLINGSNAGQAISEAVWSLRAEETPGKLGPRLTEGQLYLHALGRSMTQIVAFLINATKATPMASFIGAPELLNALTDSSSFSSDRKTTYWLLLIFYVALVMLVVWLCGRARRTLERRLAAA